jgi:hypothetical protein
MGKGVVMPGNEGKINVLFENFDDMTDEGKNELLKIGEKYLNELNLNDDKKLISKVDGLKFNDEKLV